MTNVCNIRPTAQILRDHFQVFDCETTGLSENDTLAEIAVVDCATREAVLDCLIRPSSPMSCVAARVHGISETLAIEQGRSLSVQLSNMFSCAEKRATNVGAIKYLTAYNLPFDRRLVLQSLYKEPSAHSAPTDVQALAIRGFISRTEHTNCVMELANRFFVNHAAWDYERSCFKRLSLEQCLELAGIEREGMAHRALSDALATVDLIRYMART